MISIDCNHPELEEFIEIKNDLTRVTKANISVKITDEFMEAVESDKDWELSFETEHETIIKVVSARKVFELLARNNWRMAEPGILFWNKIEGYNILSEDHNFKYAGVNPCFTGDMKLLTNEGFKTLKELCDTEPLIYSYDGVMSKGKVWCNGEKETIKLIMSNGKEITCTPDHRFMTMEGEECEASKLKNKKIMPKIYKTIKDDELFIKLGFIQGDGQLSRLESQQHKGMEVNIGEKDGDIRHLFEEDDYSIKSHRAIYLRGYNDLMEDMCFSYEILPYRVMPRAYYEWDLNKKANFLQGCFSANGCVNSNRRISYKTTCKEFALELIKTLNVDFGITAILTTNKKRMVEFENGEYECRESYDVNINKYDDIILFSQYINFYQNYKKIRLAKLIEERVPYVRNIKENGKELVYDFKEPRNHWGIIEGYVAHNCAEEPLPAGGSCLLGSFNLSAYVKEDMFDFVSFTKDINTVVKAMNEVLDEGLPLHPLQIQRDTVRDYRQIGIGVMGIADMLIKLGIKYDSEEALAICDRIAFVLADKSIMYSSLLAKEYGSYPKCNIDSLLKSDFIKNNTTNATCELLSKYGLRNSQILTIAPTGSLSTMIGVSGGIEPIFSLSYTRKTESLHGKDVYYKVYTPIAKEYMDNHNISEEVNLPSYFVTTNNLNPFKRIEMQGVWQKHIDASISSTINLPNEATEKTVYDLYMYAWKCGLKGLTIYRSGCEREGILEVGEKDKNDEGNNTEVNVLKRGDWEQKPRGIIEIPRKIKTGCGKELMHITISPSEKRIVDFYITSSSAGGCKHNIQAVAISMSGMLRLGGSLDNIRQSFRGLGACSSYTVGREKGRDVSKGVSCPTAILNTLLKVQEDLENNCLEELELLGAYGNNDYINESLLEVEEIEDGKFTLEEIKCIQENGEVVFAKKYNRCPKCNSHIEHTGGCVTCMNCGWTKCD